MLLRFLMTDDPGQHAKAVEFFRGRSAESPAYVSLLVFVETCWVMNRHYRINNRKISLLFHGLMDSREIAFEDPDFIASIFSADGFEKLDISDYVIAAMATKAGCLKTVTFDNAAARRVPHMELLA